MDEGKTKNVVRGALLLTVAGLVSKILSATYRIPLQNLTGDMGFYIYQQIYPIIGMVMILGLYGFPVAVSKLVAERKQTGNLNHFRQVYFPLCMILVGIAAVFSTLLFLLAPQLAGWIDDPKLVSTFRLAAGIVLLLPFLSLLRGISQGHDNMKPTAYSQIVEQLIRVTIIITSAYLIFIGKLDIYMIGEAGVFASLLGMGTIIFVWLFYVNRNKSRTPETTKEKIPWVYYIRICFSLGLIASLSHMILILMQLVDVFTIVPRLVNVGWLPELAMQTKGTFDRGQPLIQLGVVFGSSFALALVPTVVTHSKDRIAAIREALLFSFYLAGAASIGLIVLMPEVNELLFKNTSGTVSLQILAPAIVLSALIITACSILQSMGHVFAVARWIVIAFVLKWVLNFTLVPIFHINGSASATVISLLVLMFAVIRLLHKKFPNLHLIRHIRWGAFFLAGGSMVSYIVVIKYSLFLHSSFSRIGLLWYVVCMISTGAAIYLICLVRCHVFSDKQLQVLPFSNGLIALRNRITGQKEDEDK